MQIKNLILQKYRNNKQLLNSFKWRLTQLLFKQGTTAVMFFIATYYLSKQDMGIYNYISATLLLLVIFSDFGISTSTSRYIAIYANKDKEQIRKVFSNIVLVILILSIIVISTTILFKEQIFNTNTHLLIYILPMIFISPLTSLLDGIYRGLRKFKTLAIVTICNSMVGILSSYLLVTRIGITGALLSQIIFFSSFSLLLLILHGKHQIKIEKKILKDILSYALPFGIATLGFYLFSKVNIVILGRYELFEEIAIYELLTKIYTVFLLPFTVLGQVLAPNVVEIYVSKKYKTILSLFKKLLKYLLLFNILFIPLTLIAVPYAIQLIFPIYATETMSHLLLPVALTFAVAVPVTVINSSILTSTGDANIMAIQNVISGTLNVLLNIFVVKTFGYLGVVWVTFIIQILSTSLLYIFYYGKLKRNSLVEK